MAIPGRALQSWSRDQRATLSERQTWAGPQDERPGCPVGSKLAITAAPAAAPAGDAAGWKEFAIDPLFTPVWDLQTEPLRGPWLVLLTHRVGHGTLGNCSLPLKLETQSPDLKQNDQ